MLVSIGFMIFGSLHSAGTDHEIVYSKVDGYHQGQLRSIYVSSIHQKSRDGRTLTLGPDAAKSFRDMKVAAAKDGFHLHVTSAFRTHREQRHLRETKGELAAKPGHSSHQMGKSVDIAGTTRMIGGKKNRTILYWWLMRNGKKFGFHNDVDGETWHWTFYKNGFERKKKRTCAGDLKCKKKKNDSNNS